MYSLLISEEATWDVSEAVDWYHNLDRKLSSKLQYEITLGFEIIQKTPLSFQTKYKNVRIYYCKTFPYGIHYLLEKETIKILAVFHTSRDPKNWDLRYTTN